MNTCWVCCCLSWFVTMEQSVPAALWFRYRRRFARPRQGWSRCRLRDPMGSVNGTGTSLSRCAPKQLDSRSLKDDFIWFRRISYDFRWFHMISGDFIWFRVMPAWSPANITGSFWCQLQGLDTNTDWEIKNLMQGHEPCGGFGVGRFWGFWAVLEIRWLPKVGSLMVDMPDMCRNSVEGNLFCVAQIKRTWFYHCLPTPTIVPFFAFFFKTSCRCQAAVHLI